MTEKIGGRATEKQAVRRQKNRRSGNRETGGQTTEIPAVGNRETGGQTTEKPAVRRQRNRRSDDVKTGGQTTTTTTCPESLSKLSRRQHVWAAAGGAEEVYTGRCTRGGVHGVPNDPHPAPSLMVGCKPGACRTTSAPRPLP